MSRSPDRAEISTIDKEISVSNELDPVAMLQELYDLASVTEDGYKNSVRQDVTALELLFEVLLQDLRDIKGVNVPILQSAEDALKSLRTDTYSVHHQLQDLKKIIGRDKNRLSRRSSNLQIVSQNSQNTSGSKKRSFEIVEPGSKVWQALNRLRAS